MLGPASVRRQGPCLEDETYVTTTETGQSAVPQTLPARPVRVHETAPLASSGSLEVRLAEGKADLEACQGLRYDVFFEEMAATPTAEEQASRRDFDRYDAICDHLMVIDRKEGGQLAGTYRLLRGDVAAAHGGYYTAGEYDLSLFTNTDHASLRYLELGRSCVHQNYRTKPVIDLLWKGIGTYVAQHQIDVMFGCASFPGRDPDEHATALSYLARAHLAPADWRARAVAERYEPLDRLAGTELDERKAFRALPPVIRGYIRAGAYVGDGAVIDHEFGTVDVLIIFPVAQVQERYRERFASGT